MLRSSADLVCLIRDFVESFEQAIAQFSLKKFSLYAYCANFVSIKSLRARLFDCHAAKQIPVDSTIQAHVKSNFNLSVTAVDP